MLMFLTGANIIVQGGTGDFDIFGREFSNGFIYEMISVDGVNREMGKRRII